MASLWYRAARGARRLVGLDRERRWNRQYAEGGWEWLRRLDELAHYAVLAGYLLRLRPGARVVELGCGEGLLLDYLHPRAYSSYLGVDFATAIAQAGHRAGEHVRFVVADMVDFAIDERFDAIVFNESLYYLPDVLAGLRRYEAMLAPGGVFLVSMCGNAGNEERWRAVDGAYTIVDEVLIRNRHGTTWTVKAFVPRDREA
jgi:SAM-dependent methyltransferase